MLCFLTGNAYWFILSSWRARLCYTR